MDKSVIDKLTRIFTEWSGSVPDNIKVFPVSGSERRYMRLSSGATTAIGTYNPNRRENKAFNHLTGVFKKAGLNVPEIYEFIDTDNIYLQEDLGDITLFDLISKRPESSIFPKEFEDLYKISLEALTFFQIDTHQNIDYRLCYPRAAFDEQSIAWDLNYFKYNYLNLKGIKYDEQLLEDDFREIASEVLKAPSDYFMFRDFQARNIMIRDGEPWFIDYQGGRRGPLQYDLISLLFQVKARLPLKFRDTLLNFYAALIKDKTGISQDEFSRYYLPVVLLRSLQVLGAYGFRGLYQGKSHFLQSLSLVYQNIEWLTGNKELCLRIPEIRRLMDEIVQTEENLTEDKNNLPGLTVSINSFSYKKGIPRDPSENGGGFVFDCRALPNPGREERYRTKTGKDPEVIGFLESSKGPEEFLRNVFDIIDTSVENYLARDFSNLMVNFGCTGGQHRSVYCAEKLKMHLESIFDVTIRLIHREL